jgi:hypothetical protein
MKVQDRVFIVGQANLYDMPIKNSISICKGEVLAVKAEIITVRIEVESYTSNTEYIIQQLPVDWLCTTPQQALEKASNLIMTKEVKDESIQQS